MDGFGIVADVLDVQSDQGGGPVQGFGDARFFPEVLFPERLDKPGGLGRKVPGQVGKPGRKDTDFAVLARVFHVVIDAPPPERVAQFPGAVGGQENQRYALGREGAEFGNGDLIIGKDFQEIGLEFLIGAVDLVNEENDGIFRLDGFEQGAAQQIVLLKNVVLALLGGQILALGNLDGQELPLIVPFVNGGGDIETLVALKPDQPPAGDLGHRLADLRLADARFAFQQQRAVQFPHEGDRRRQLPVRDIAHGLQVAEQGLSIEFHETALEPPRPARPGRLPFISQDLSLSSVSRFCRTYEATAYGSRPGARRRR